VRAPWAEVIPVAWAIGPSTHPADDHAHGESATAGPAIDPVCGMTVLREAAMEKGLHIRHEGAEYYFCGKGCRLDFQDDPTIYLAPGYIPSM
jgi:YHS domain-containing protein